MEIDVVYTDKVDEDISYQLNNLSTSISKNCDVGVQTISSVEKGQKDAGLILGLTIAGLAVSAIDTLINVLTYWQSQQTKYSVEFSIEGKTYSLESSSLKSLRNAIAKVEKEMTSKVKILIGKK
jgi:hypothetical protein